MRPHALRFPIILYIPIKVHSPLAYDLALGTEQVLDRAVFPVLCRFLGEDRGSAPAKQGELNERDERGSRNRERKERRGRGERMERAGRGAGRGAGGRKYRGVEVQR
jgi:hypothetical protein